MDQDVAATFERVARALAAVEGEKADEWLPKFRWALENGAFPLGESSNAGAEAYKPAVSLINCTVSRTIRDSMRDILDSVVDAGMTLKSGAGIGYDFSTCAIKVPLCLAQEQAPMARWRLWISTTRCASPWPLPEASRRADGYL